MTNQDEKKIEIIPDKKTAIEENKELTKCRRTLEEIKFPIDEKQIILFYKFITHNKNRTHKFQLFLPDRKTIGPIEVKNTDNLVNLCRQHNLKGLSCLSVNSVKLGGMKAYDVETITNILFDVDVKKERKVNGVSTEQDKKIAYETALKVKQKLEEKINLRVSLIDDSGNGYHLVIPINIPVKTIFTGKNNDENKKIWEESEIRGRLVALEEQLKEFNNDVCEIDCISKDIARRFKIPGTWNVKGEISPDNYRQCTIIVATEDAISDAFIDGNTKVFNTLEPKKESIIDVEIPVDEDIALKDIFEKNEKAKDLFNGEWQKYDKKKDGTKKNKWSKSEAELSLCVILFNEGLPEEKIRNALAQSKIGKWKQSTSYRDATIKKAKQFVKKLQKEKKDKQASNTQGVIITLHKGNITVDLLNPKLAWREIKCYEMNEEFVLQPIYYPVRVKKEITNKSGEIETKYSEEMKIVLLCVDKDANREVIYPYSGAFSNSTFVINDSKYKIPSEPFYLKSLPGLNILQRFLDGEKVDGKKIWKDFKEYRGTYLDVGEDKRKLIPQTAWDLGSHFHMVFNAFPYHDFYGFRGSGKNRSHEISKELCFHAQMIATTRSISSVFRSIDAMGSTWLKNEAETLRGKNKNEDLLELCLEGYKKGSSIPLTSDVGKDKSRPQLYFDVYSPKSFTSDRNIYGAFGTRMIKYLQQKTSGRQGKIELDIEEGNRIRDNAYLLRLQDGRKITKLAKTSIDELLKGYDLDLVSRDREIFFPLLIITKEYGSKQEFEDLISFIKDYLEQLRQENIDKPIAVVLRAIYGISYEKQKIDESKHEFWIYLHDIRKKIIFNDPEAWRLTEKQGYEDKEIIKTSETAKYYTGRRIGSILVDLGFESKRQLKGQYQRKIDINSIEKKAKVLNIPIEDAIDREVLNSW